jgi:hypothetical protein
MAVLADKKIIGGPFANAREIVRVVYDFAADTGAIADYEVLESDGNCIVKLAFAVVKTAVTSSDALVADLGKGAGGTEFWSDKAVSALTDESVHVADAEYPAIKLADGEKVVLGIEAFAATAGKIEFVFEVYKY